ncbi:hypothetical protein ACA910_014171 [Epithemia clementina (nom. ined.)]
MGGDPFFAMSDDSDMEEEEKKKKKKKNEVLYPDDDDDWDELEALGGDPFFAGADDQVDPPFSLSSSSPLFAAAKNSNPFSIPSSRGGTGQGAMSIFHQVAARKVPPSPQLPFHDEKEKEQRRDSFRAYNDEELAEIEAMGGDSFFFAPKEELEAMGGDPFFASTNNDDNNDDDIAASVGGGGAAAATADNNNNHHSPEDHKNNANWEWDGTIDEEAHFDF